MQRKKFLLSFFCGFLLVVIGFWGLLRWYIPKLKVEGWLQDVLWCKLDIAAHTPSPKIIVMSGSNAFFGMDSSVLEKKCGFPVVNLAFHAGFPMSLYHYLLQNVIKEGDIIVMPLELTHYSMKSKKNKLQMQVCIGWGKEFFPEEDLLETYLFYTLPVVWDLYFIKSIPGNIKKFFKEKPMSKTEILDCFQRSKEAPDEIRKSNIPSIYDFRNMNKYGDIVLTKNADCTFKQKIDSVPSPLFLEEFDILKSLVQKKKAKLILVWPVLFAGYDLQKILDLQQNCKDKGITIYGDPRKFMFPASEFADSHYHLRSTSAKKRTEILAECLIENGLLTQSAGKRQENN